MKIKTTAGEQQGIQSPSQNAPQRGFIRLILLIVIALLVISYFGINIRQVVESPITKDNVSYVASTTVTVWDKYLKIPATYVWNQVFVELIWKPAIANLGKQATQSVQGSMNINPTSTPLPLGSQGTLPPPPVR